MSDFVVAYLLFFKLLYKDYEGYIKLASSIKYNKDYTHMLSESDAISILRNIIKYKQKRILRSLLKNPEWLSLYLTIFKPII